MTAEIHLLNPRSGPPYQRTEYEYDTDRDDELEALAETIRDLGNAMKMLDINSKMMIHPVARDFHTHTLAQLQTSLDHARWLYRVMEEK